MANQSTQPMPRLADRMAAARRERFVGRKAELELFRSALLADEPPFALLHLYGPGGIGKTTLLREYARLAEQNAVPTVLLDGRGFDPSPVGFMLALRQALGIDETASPVEALAQSERAVLLVDTFETLAPLDTWLRETFLPQLPGQSLIVIAGRNPPTSAWRSDLDWANLTRVVSLRNLRPEESQMYLTIRGFPANQHREVLDFTHGHPLALSLVADVLGQNQRSVPFRPQDEPDVVRALLERFVHQLPNPLYRQTLEICALVRITSEAILADLLSEEVAHEAFDWLRGLSFIEQNPQGLFPHDLAREVLVADLRWRNLDRFQDLHRRVRHHIVRKMQEDRGSVQQQACFDFIYLQRTNSVANFYFDWESFGTMYASPARQADHAAILDMIQRHEGEASADIAHFWLQRQPQAFTLYCTADQQPIGFLATLTITTPTEEELGMDPALDAAWTFIRRHAPLRPGEELSYKRFWTGRDHYQVPSAVFNMVVMSSLIEWITRPQLAWSFASYADPEFWHNNYQVINFQRSPEADFDVDGQRYGVFTHDWRLDPVTTWLDNLGQHGLALTPDVPASEPRPSELLVVLSETEFADAVRQALRDYTRPDLLGANPLMRSRLVVEATGSHPSPATLQRLLANAAAALAANPRDDKYYRAIHRTYLQPAPTQELAAEQLDLPFSTYRYHLSNGLKQITHWLWQRELHGFEPDVSPL